MRALAGLITAGPLQAVLVIVLCTVLSFLAPPLTSIFSYAGAAALALYCLHLGAGSGSLVLGLSLLGTGGLTELLFGQGLAVAVTSLLLWLPVWLAALTLRGSHSLALSLLMLTGLAMVAVLAVFVAFGDPAQWWLERLQDLIAALQAQPEMNTVDVAGLTRLAEAAAPVMTGSLAAGLSFAAATCLLLGRWWQSLLVRPGALRQEFYALRLTRSLSLLGIGIVALAGAGLGVLSTLAVQWALIVMVLFVFVGMAVIHASLANLQASRGWLIAIYVLIGLLPHALLLVVLTGAVDPWLDLRRRTAQAKTN
jgi:hypothetical protein